MKLILDLATVDKLKLDGIEVEKILATGDLGEMMILPNHANMVTSLGTGSFSYYKNSVWHWACLHGGFLQVVDNKVIVLAETMEFANEINLERAKQDLEKAEEDIRKLSSETSQYEKALAAKRKAKARISSYEKKH